MKSHSDLLLLVIALLFGGVQVVSGGVVSSAPTADQLHVHPQCPLWYQYYDTSRRNCTCLPDWLLRCDDIGNAFLDHRHNILFYNASKRLLSWKVAKNFQLLLWTQGYNFTKPGQMLLPKQISRLNDYMCMPLNRKGYLHVCRECAEGFGPSISAYMGNIHMYAVIAEMLQAGIE